MLQLKKHSIKVCIDILQDKIQSLGLIMQEVTTSANNETKSSAGDKHETSRAMMQLEQEKLSKQIAELAEQKKEFDKIDFSKTYNNINQGSLVETNKGYFLIASSIGRIIVDDNPILVISSKSPLAIAFKSMKPNEMILFNGVEYIVFNVC